MTNEFIPGFFFKDMAEDKGQVSTFHDPVAYLEAIAEALGGDRKRVSLALYQSETPFTSEEVAEKLKISTDYAHHMLEELANAGLVDRGCHPEGDKTHCEYSFSAEAKEVLDSVLALATSGKVIYRGYFQAHLK